MLPAHKQEGGKGPRASFIRATNSTCEDSALKDILPSLMPQPAMEAGGQVGRGWAGQGVGFSMNLEGQQPWDHTARL